MLKVLIVNPALRRLAGVVPAPMRERLATALGLRPREDPAVEAVHRNVERRLDSVALAHDRSWQAVRTREEWERFREVRVAALRRSLGPLPARGLVRDVHVTGARRIHGVVVENLVIAGPASLSITANLYRPESSAGRAPGIVICHSHHADKTQDELQDMGFLWAHVGCAVLIPDLVGHGERRLHPFQSPSDYRLPFKANRQDYYFRYNLGLQLALAGRSLMGWMVGDVIRVLDVLVGRPDVDPDRVLLIGSVAGGGDVAAVVAALDSRVSGLVAFDYGGQTVSVGTEDTEDAEARIPGTDRGSWESTRNLRMSARDGFLPWVVLACGAPRPLVYGREFAWDRENDPTWARLQGVYELYDATDRLAGIHGGGSVEGAPPHNTHCTNVGTVHRRGLHPVLQRWFGIPLPDERTRTRWDPAELRCLNETPPAPVGVLSGVAETAAHERAVPVNADAFRKGIASLLGVDSMDAAVARSSRSEGQSEIVQFRSGDGIEFHLALSWPRGGSKTPLPLVLGFCQQGWRALGRARRSTAKSLLQAGVAVCLSDLRGTGPARGDVVRGRHGVITEVAASELMLGRTMLGWRLTDLRAVLRYLRARPELDAARVVLWGDSLAPVNPRGRDLDVPFDAGAFPELSEPLGGLLALLAGLYEEGIHAVVARGTLIRFASLLETPFCYVPSDVIVPGILGVCEIDDLAAAMAPVPLIMDGLVDGSNRDVDQGAIDASFLHTREAFAEAGAADKLQLEPGRLSDHDLTGSMLDLFRAASLT